MLPTQSCLVQLVLLICIGLVISYYLGPGVWSLCIANQDVGFFFLFLFSSCI